MRKGSDDEREEEKEARAEHVAEEVEDYLGNLPRRTRDYRGASPKAMRAAIVEMVKEAQDDKEHNVLDEGMAGVNLERPDVYRARLKEGAELPRSDGGRRRRRCPRAWGGARACRRRRRWSSWW